MTPLRFRRLGGGLAALVCALLLIVGAGSAHAVPTFPALTGRVVDQANVLPPQARADLTAKLADLQAKTSRQLVVVTLSSLQGDDIADYGYQLGRAWGIGQKGTNNGVLFITVPAEHKVRIEVGYGLEGQMTDALSSVILQTAVIPKFKAGDVPGGIVAGTDALIRQLSLDPSTAEQKAAAAAQAAEQQQVQAPARRGSALGVIVNIVFFLIVLSFVFGRRRGGGGGFWPAVFIGGMLGGGGGGSYGGGGGGGSDDSFGGGGGSFGGGGSSGSW